MGHFIEKDRVFLRGVFLFVILFLFVGYEMGVILPPRLIKNEIKIERGANARDIARILKESGIIRSEHFFVWGVKLFGIHDKLGAGTFIFSEPTSLISVARQLAMGSHEIVLLIREGDDQKEIARSLNAIGLDGAGFLSLVKQKKLEGYLFPDTYRFFEGASASEVVEILVDNFNKKTSRFLFEAQKSAYTKEDIIKMASIIESEVRIPEDRRVISGILWKRLMSDMPLQVDVALETYERRGLPQFSVSNPGLDAIDAALNPTKTAFWYYLSSKDGTTHFARTFEEHKLNKARYLR